MYACRSLENSRVRFAESGNFAVDIIILELGCVMRFDVLNCYSLTVGWPKCLMLAVMLEHFSIEHCKTVIREDQKVPKEFRVKSG